jgi:prepilin-type N-terminal cleavage/methylation domain
MARRKRTSGFTLIEVMITVAITGILASIAFPAYSDYVVRSKMTDIALALNAVATAAAEYHATASPSAFPDELTLFVRGYSDRYGTIEVIASSTTHGEYGIRSIQNLSPRIDGSYLYITITFDPHEGYTRAWNSNLQEKYKPKS